MTTTQILNRCRKAYAANSIPWTPEVAHLIKKMPTDSALALAECWERRANEQPVDERAMENRLLIQAAKRIIHGVARRLSCRSVSRQQFIATQRAYHGHSYRDE